MKKRRVGLSFEEADFKKLARLAKKLRPYQPVGTTLSEILLQLVTPCNSKLQLVTLCDGVQHGDAKQAEPETEIIEENSGTDLALKKEKKKKEKKREGGVIEEVASQVIARVNELRPEGSGFRPATYHKPIGRLLAKGFTAEDLIAVAEWKAEECRRRADWQWFKPATLFRFERFAEKLDEALAGVVITGQTGFALTEADQRAQRFTRRKAGHYPDHPVRGQK